MPLGAAARDEDREIVRLTESQAALLDFLAHQRRAAIHGVAGSGKTFLALEKAKRLAAEGFRTLLTCYNVPLEEHLRRSSSVPGLTIQRFHRLCVEGARAGGVTVAEHPVDHPDGDYWRNTLPRALQEGLKRGFEPFDAIVVDEAQDFDDTYWLPLQCCLKEPDSGVLYVFLDKAQRIYGAESSLIAELPRFDLPYNVRNSRAIHALTARIAPEPPPSCAGPPGRHPELIAVPDGSMPNHLLPGIVQRLVQQEAFRPSDIAILTGRKLQNAGLDRSQRMASWPLTGADAPQEAHVTLDVIHRFKGLDAPVVILTALDGMPPDKARTVLYVGMTRARSHLIIVEREAVLRSFGIIP